MRSRLLALVVAVIVVCSLGCTVLAATAKPVAKPAAKPAAAPAAKPAADAKFDQTAVLEKMWAAPDDTVVGTVNGVAVTKKELLKALWFWNAPSQLRDLLTQKMIEQAAKKAGVTVTQQEIDAKVKEALERSQMNSIDQLTEQYGITKQRFMAATKLNALVEKTVRQGLKVSDAEYAEYMKARHILVRFPQDEKDEAKRKEIAKQKIDEIAAKVKAGEDFAKLADEYSEDPGNTRDGKKQGGDLGWFNKGRMVQEFEKAAFNLKAGEVSEPVETFYGYHLIKAEKLGKDATPAEKAELKNKIIEQKMQAEMGAWFQRTQSSAKMENRLMPPPKPQPMPEVKPPSRPAPAPKPSASEKPSESSSEKPASPPPPPPPAEPSTEKPDLPPPPPPPAQ